MGYVDGAEKVWFSGIEPLRSYLQVLCQGSDLFAQGLKMVPHGAADNRYKAILKGNFADVVHRHALADTPAPPDLDEAIGDEVAEEAARDVDEAPAVAEHRDEDSDEEGEGDDQSELDLEAALEAELEKAGVWVDVGEDPPGGGLPASELPPPAPPAEPAAGLPPLPPPAEPPELLPEMPPPPPAPPAEPAEVQEGLPEAFRIVLRAKRWGAFSFTPRQAGGTYGVWGGYQGRCPFHRFRPGSDCKKFVATMGPSREDRLLAVRRLASW